MCVVVIVYTLYCKSKECNNSDLTCPWMGLAFGRAFLSQLYLNFPGRDVTVHL